MKKRQISIFTLLIITATFLFTACGQEAITDQTVSEVASTSSSAPFVPQTETEYRQEIAKLQGDASVADTLQEYYEPAETPSDDSAGDGENMDWSDDYL